MKKNVASQSIGAQMITISDGSDFTGTVSVVVTIDNGTQTAGGGTVTHEGGGYHSYAPTQAETNGDHIAFTFSGTGAISSTTQTYTFFPQAADNGTAIGALNDFNPATDQVAGVTLVGTTTTNTDMRGTDDAALATALAAQNNFDPTADTVANVTTVDTTTTNTDMRGTDGANTAVPDNATIAQNNVDINALNDLAIGDIFTGAAAIDTTGSTIDLVTATTDVTNQVTADATAINGNATSASNLEKSALALDPTTVAAGTITTTSFPTNLTSTVDDFYIGLPLKFITGTLAGQGTEITDYVGSTKTVTVVALTSAPSASDEFVVS